jgi:hypothetical protein
MEIALVASDYCDGLRFNPYRTDCSSLLYYNSSIIKQVLLSDVLITLFPKKSL